MKGIQLTDDHREVIKWDRQHHITEHWVGRVFSKVYQMPNFILVPTVPPEQGLDYLEVLDTHSWKAHATHQPSTHLFAAIGQRRDYAAELQRFEQEEQAGLQ